LLTFFLKKKADGLRKAVTATRVLFGGDLSTLSGDHIIEAFKTDTNRFIQLERSSVIGSGLDKIASITNAAKSKCKFIIIQVAHLFTRECHI
jgi:tyrosyl-tRNA synthetase